MLSYNKLDAMLLSRGYSLNSLKNKGLVSDHEYKKILKNKSIHIGKLIGICNFLGVTLDDIIDINYTHESSSTESD